MSDLVVRPMRGDDVAACEAISSAAYLEVDRRTYARAWPDPTPRTQDRAQVWRERTAHLLATDPGGCWVAESQGEVVGFATSMVRELMWILASYAVSPRAQGQGVGRVLLDAALAHGRGCLRGMFNASQDQGALRRYRQAGFDLHPQITLRGHVERSLLPAGIAHVRDGERGVDCPGDLPSPSDPLLVERARAAKAALGDRVFFILGHHYQRDEVIQFADVTGDSFKLAQQAAARPEAEFIVFCGVHFMAESADILTSPDQQVILPDLAAGCSMADMAAIDQVEDCVGPRWRRPASPTSPSPSRT
jgi:GNAT superfamily N-acetyltransferase